MSMGNQDSVLSYFQAQAEEQTHQIEALTAQLEHLMASKAQLESRCHLLEKVVKMREAPISANSQVPHSNLHSCIILSPYNSRAKISLNDCLNALCRKGL